MYLGLRFQGSWWWGVGSRQGSRSREPRGHTFIGMQTAEEITLEGEQGPPAVTSFLQRGSRQCHQMGTKGSYTWAYGGVFRVQTTTTAQLSLSEARKLRFPHPPACSLVKQNKGIPIPGTGGAGNGECWGHVDRKRMGAADACTVPWQER